MAKTRCASLFLLVIIATSATWGAQCDPLPGIECSQAPEYPRMAHYAKAAPDSRSFWQKLVGLDRPPFENSIALLVGVGQYSKMTKLPFVANDVREMRKYLLNEGQFNDVYVLEDDDIDANSLRGLMVNVFVEKLVGADARFLFYYSGHGSPEADGNGHFLLWGAKPGTYDPTWDLPVSEIPLWSKRLRAKHVLFLLDGCGLGLGLPAKAAPGDRIALISNNGSRVALAATRGGEDSYGTKDGKNSIFTSEFLRILRSGKADPDHIGFTTIDIVSALMQRGMADAVVGTSMAGAFNPVIPNSLDLTRNGSFIFVTPDGSTALAASNGVGVAKGKSESPGIIRAPPITLQWGPPVKCGLFTFSRARTIESTDIVEMSGDSATMRQIIAHAGSSAAYVRLDEYRDQSTGAIVAVPAGFQLLTDGDGCTAIGHQSLIRIFGITVKKDEPVIDSMKRSLSGMVSGLDSQKVAVQNFWLRDLISLINGKPNSLAAAISEKSVSSNLDSTADRPSAYLMTSVGRTGLVLLVISGKEVRQGFGYNCEPTNTDQHCKDYLDWVSVAFAQAITALPALSIPKQ